MWHFVFCKQEMLMVENDNGFVSHQSIKCDINKLIKLYQALGLKSYPLECPNLLKLILSDDPKFVVDVLKDNVQKQLNQKTRALCIL